MCKLKNNRALIHGCLLLFLWSNWDMRNEIPFALLWGYFVVSTSHALFLFLGELKELLRRPESPPSRIVHKLGCVNLTLLFLTLFIRDYLPSTYVDGYAMRGHLLLLGIGLCVESLYERRDRQMGQRKGTCHA